VITFHEGLPRSGKSYEACCMHILPAIAKGRTVVTNMAGINHQKFSDLTNTPLETVQKLLICIDDDCDETDENMQREFFIKNQVPDSLFVVDEIQNLFPSDRSKLPQEWQTFISKHGHYGIDILLMGQDRRDVHNLWRRRIQRVITFRKMEAIGKPNAYRWECFENVGKERFKAVTSGQRTYEELYFGLYKSHTDATTNKDVYADDRANIFNNKSIRFYLPLAAFGFCYAIYWVFGIFNSGLSGDVQNEQKTASVSVPAVAYPPTNQANIAPVEVVELESQYAPIDIFDDLANSYRARLSGLVVSKSSGRFVGVVDILNKSYHKQESFTFDELISMGWDITLLAHGVEIFKGNVRYLVRAWPIDKAGRVDRSTLESF
jgi:zona occludens toxin